MPVPGRSTSIWSRVSTLITAVTLSQAAWFTLAVAIFVRLLLWLAYGPVVYSDSLSYRRLAAQILAGWPNFDGSRVPGYPVFLAYLGEDARVYLTQLILGIFITLFFFYIAWRLSGLPWLAALVGLLHSLNLGQLFFEANLLTETLATFLVMAALAGVIHGMYHIPDRRSGLAFLIGAASALAVLTRPNFIFLPPWLFLWIVLAWNPQAAPAWTAGQTRQALLAWISWLWQSLRRQWLTLAALTLPVVFLVFGWMGFIHRQYGDWALSTMTGYHLMQHTGSFFEFVPDEYAGLRDTYLRYRDERIALYGTQANTIWDAIPAMQEASGLNFYDLSRTLARLSGQLIRQHPVLFLRSVAGGWWLFWRVPVYWSPDALRGELRLLPGAVEFIRALILVQRLAMFAANLFFILSPLIWLIQRRWYKIQTFIAPQSWLAWMGLLGIVWIASMVQAVLDHGDNPRFLVPLQSVVVFWFIVWLWQVGFPLLGQLRVKSR